MRGKGCLTAAEVAVLVSIWPKGTHHQGPAADVFTATGQAGQWLLIAKRPDGAYVMIEDSGNRSMTAGSLAELGLPDQPISRRRGTERIDAMVAEVRRFDVSSARPRLGKPMSSKKLRRR
jgi:hypothetical protein